MAQRRNVATDMPDPAIRGRFPHLVM